MMAMGVGDFKMITSMGPGIAIAVAVTLAAALTLSPALLSIFGHYLFWPLHTREKHEGEPRGFFASLARAVSRRPVIVTIGLTAALLVPVLYLPQVNSNFDVLADLPKDADSRIGYEQIGDHLGEDKLVQSTALVDLGGGGDILAPAQLAKLHALMEDLQAGGGIATTTSIVTPDGDTAVPDGFRPSKTLGEMADGFKDDGGGSRGHRQRQPPGPRGQGRAQPGPGLRERPRRGVPGCRLRRRAGASPGMAWSTRSTSSTAWRSRASCPAAAHAVRLHHGPVRRGRGRLGGRLGLHAHERLPRGARRGLPGGQGARRLQGCRQGRQGPRVGRVDHGRTGAVRCVRPPRRPLRRPAGRLALPGEPGRHGQRQGVQEGGRGHLQRAAGPARRARGGVRDPLRRLLPPDVADGRRRREAPGRDRCLRVRGPHGDALLPDVVQRALQRGRVRDHQGRPGRPAGMARPRSGRRHPATSAVPPRSSRTSRTRWPPTSSRSARSRSWAS